MVRLLFVVLIGTFCAAHPALAGAWLREEGRGFFSLSTTTTTTMDTSYSGYLEYGLRPKATIGASVDISTFNTPLFNTGITIPGMTGTARLFLRKPLWPASSKGVFAYELGVGANFTTTDITPVARAGLSYGRGIAWKERKGWLAVDTAIEWDFGTQMALAKVDGTAGLDISDRLTGMFQTFLTVNDLGDIGATFTPSLIYRPKKGKMRFVGGVEIKQAPTKSYAFKLGLWHDF